MTQMDTNAAAIPTTVTTSPLALLRQRFENAGVVFNIPCAGMWGNNPISAKHADRYHPFLIEHGWDAFFAEARKRYLPLVDRVRSLLKGPSKAMVSENVPILLNKPFGVDPKNEIRPTMGPTLRMGGTKHDLGAFGEAFRKHFPECEHVMVYVGPTPQEDPALTVLRSWRTVAEVLRSRSELSPDRRTVTICVDSMGVGITPAAMLAIVHGNIPLETLAVEPAPIATGYTERCWGCVLTTDNWHRVLDHGVAVQRRPKNVWLLLKKGDNEGERLERVLKAVREDPRVSVCVNNDAWDEPIVDAILGV